MAVPVLGEAATAEVLEALAAGSVVAIPTDTVYGLAARLDRPDALAAIFELKGRPADLALPVLIGRWGQLDEVAETWPRDASMLAARFWPGPLTVVVPARPAVGPLVGSSRATVGIRRPKHRLVRSLCRRAGPLAVTSANRHGEPPCRTADEVVRAFDPAAADPAAADQAAGDQAAGPVAVPALALVVDGGRCDGAPSTVADCTVSPPVCLREGAVPWEWVEAALR